MGALIKFSKIDYFDSNFIKNLKKDNTEQYFNFLNDLTEDVSQGYESDILSETFQHQFRSIIFSNRLKKFNFINFYWLSLVERLISGMQLIEECEEEQDEENFEFLFSFWENSEYAGSLFESMESESQDLIKVSKNFLLLLEDQIVSFFYLHISEENHSFEENIVYNLIPELGDNTSWIFLSDTELAYKGNKETYSFPSILIKEINKSDNYIELDSEFDEISIPTVKMQNMIELDKHIISIRPSCELGFLQKDKITSEIQSSLSLIKKYHPALLDIFFEFTHTIVPINEPGVVSYSMQNLPGVSCINVFERDIVDRIDDLIHENGHHYLNYILNLEELIFEDDEKVFYSPWRRALRPIRGLYHAVFTFYWAMELFHKLSSSLIDELNSEQSIKCQKRFLEEFIMIEYCIPQCKTAFEHKKISLEGLKVIEPIFKKIEDYKMIAQEIEDGLKVKSQASYSEIQELKKVLIGSSPLI